MSGDSWLDVQSIVTFLVMFGAATALTLWGFRHFLAASIQASADGGSVGGARGVAAKLAAAVGAAPAKGAKRKGSQAATSPLGSSLSLSGAGSSDEAAVERDPGTLDLSWIPAQQLAGSGRSKAGKRAGRK